jgi:signal transduction histidine kinase
MREFAIPLLEARDIRFSFDLVSADYERVPMNARRNIFLIFKEAIHNIIRHAGCTTVSILTGIRNNQFLLQVMDDGKGFETAAVSNRHGLQNMFHRAASCNGHLTVDSTPGAGTKIVFTVKIK